MNPRLTTLVRPILFLVTFTMIPQLSLRPLWSTSFAAVLLAYRYWLDFRGGRIPPRWALFIAQLAAALGVWEHYHSFMGDEAGGTFLCLLTCLKLYELREKRDFFITCMLCIMALMGYLLIEQGLLMTAFLVVDVVFIFAFLFALESERWDWAVWRGYLRTSGGMSLKSIPFLVLIFVLFPRFSTGFGTHSTQAGHTGVADSLHPGSLAQLIPTDELIFRASFLNGEVPSRNLLYWRGVVLDHSNGLNWDRDPEGEHRGVPLATGGSPDLEIFLEPSSDRFLYTLEDAGQLVFPNDRNGNWIVSRGGGVYELNQPIQTRERYYIENALTPNENVKIPGARYTETETPPSEAMKKFLRPLLGLSVTETVRDLMAIYAKGGYAYSLQPPPVASIDDFMFKTKEGFCEHYAGSMATILRYLKIPSRVVIGFQGGSRSFLDNYISVRSRDAHAWLEYYDSSSHRWRKVDPTMQVSPTRLSEGSDSYFAQDHALIPAWLPDRWSILYFRSRAFVDEVEASWVGFLLRFDLARQKELLAKLGMEEALFRALPVFLVLFMSLIFAFLYYFEARKRAPLSPEERFYRQLLRQLERWKIQKLPNEGPLALLQKVRQIRPELEPAVAPILESLVLVRFGGRPLDGQIAESIRLGLRQLKKLSIK